MSFENLVPPERLRAMQIIAAALPAGVVAFTGVVLFLVYGRGNAAPPAGGQLPMISMVAALFFLVTGALSFVMPAIIIQNGIKQIALRPSERDHETLLGLRQASMIVGMAMLEGVSFLGLIAFLIERQPLVLTIPGLGLLGMLARFPKENSVRNWLELQGRRVQELRQDRASL